MLEEHMFRFACASKAVDTLALIFVWGSAVEGIADEVGGGHTRRGC